MIKKQNTYPIWTKVRMSIVTLCILKSGSGKYHERAQIGISQIRPFYYIIKCLKGRHALQAYLRYLFVLMSIIKIIEMLLINNYLMNRMAEYNLFPSCMQKLHLNQVEIVSL